MRRRTRTRPAEDKGHLTGLSLLSVELRRTADWAAGQYRAIDPHWAEDSDVVDGALRCSPPGPLLDAGCGEGHHVARALKYSLASRVVGLDFSDRMLLLARSMLSGMDADPQWDLLLADIREMPLDDSAVSVVICMNNTFGLLVADDIASAARERDKGMAEIARVLSPGGYLVLTVLNACRFDHNTYGSVWRLVTPMCNLAAGDLVLETIAAFPEQRVYYTHWFSKGEIVALARKHGLDVASYEQREARHVFLFKKD